MKIQPTRPLYEPAWVHADMLDQLWRRNRNYYIEDWSGEPKKGWFAYDEPHVKTAFETADIYLNEIDGQITIGFINGRHRTRWLLTLGNPLIPVGLEQNYFEQALQLGLAVSRVNPLETLVF